RDPQSVNVALPYDARRGSPAEYDAGAPADSKWIELFGSTPNYRALGVEALGGTAKTDEKFRWEFGPMWYRGRLTPESVKVFVVGQEGAQDENVSNRAFTGSTGTRTQRFLNHLGIHRSYLFLNTFVYTINGQLEDDPRFKWIEQGEDSPIVEYRHKLFDNMMATNANTVALFMGVGSGGKASLATWINARGGKCSTAWELKNCDTRGMKQWFKENRGIEIKNDILAIGVPHPGGANPNLGGDAAMENIKAGFSGAAQRVAAYKVANKNWLPQDIDEKATPEELIARLQAGYTYKGYAPIPFRDFAFNTNWRMGSEGTTSNRWGANSIQVYSDAGEYNDKNSQFPYKPQDLDSGMNEKKTALIGMGPRDLPYESPRYYAGKWSADRPDFDYGPCGYLRYDQGACDLSEALVSWPNMKSLGINYISHDSFGYFGTYRGRGKGAQVYVVMDQTSHDDFFSARAVTGAEGQKLQAILNRSGVGLNYFIQRSLPVDTLGLSTSDLISGVTAPEMTATYKRIYDAVSRNSDIKVVVAVGPVAKAIVNSLQLSGVELVALNNLSSIEADNAAIKTISQALGTQASNYNGELMTIPREDLPYHSRWWMGSSGDRGYRGENYSQGNYYRVYAPQWVSRLYPLPLTKEEKEDLAAKMKKHVK
ncbi:MAG: hypothetical protein NDI63_14520, partial [Pseudobdellovibrio sp.]|nr:hypothetical protein [Pseudobdellovibrio sp.]